VDTRHVLVFGDSLTFHGPAGPVPLADPRLFPNVLAAALQRSATWAAADSCRVRADVVARLGWTARDAWWALTKDPVVATVLAPRASALVLAVGQMDQLPAAVPTYLRDGIAYLRPGGLRRCVPPTGGRGRPSSR
jgi:diglucosylglycerate octanoyltransferase